MKQKPEIVQAKTVAKSRLFEIEQLDLRFSNGEERIYERLVNRGFGAVLIIPIVDDEHILLVREYVAGSHAYELGFPKGLIEKDEDLLEAANRELQEEVGYAANKLTKLQPISLAPGYMSSKTTLVFAEDLVESRLPGDEPETIEVVPWKLSDLEVLLNRQDFTEARSIAALFMVREYLNNNRQMPW